jgi:hypothetical protein
MFDMQFLIFKQYFINNASLYKQVYKDCGSVGIVMRTHLSGSGNTVSSLEATPRAWITGV